ncbi:MAG: type 2 isopentenyl-diphosphate Delta-isomerase [Anaerolineales bacterium]|jgi:isopentenyl-diphosphate delta-isomerase
MTKVTPTSDRKKDHIRINLEQDTRSGLTTNLENYHFKHNAVPELNLEEIATSTTFLGKPLTCPLLISSMTGGTPRAAEINTALAEAAQKNGIAIGLGSQRAAIEDPELADTYRIRETAPDIVILANLGAVQLNYGYGIDACRRAVEMVEADALILHLNALQEALQPNGDTRFAGLLKRIEEICRNLEVPVIAKEVGWGISAEAARQLVDAGVHAIDVAGAGGTSWSQVELHRAETKAQETQAAIFRTWGIPTAEAVIQVHEALPAVPLIASGGLRSGIDIAKCVAIGADLCGIAGPFLKAATQSAERVSELILQYANELRVCMFAAGAANLHALQDKILRIES